MPTYGYIRTSRDQEPGHPGSDPHVQRRQLVEAGPGVDPVRIYADVGASGAKALTSPSGGRSKRVHRPSLATASAAQTRVIG